MGVGVVAVVALVGGGSLWLGWRMGGGFGLVVGGVVGVVAVCGVLLAAALLWALSHDGS
jgi:hypothetical protein